MYATLRPPTYPCRSTQGAGMQCTKDLDVTKENEAVRRNYVYLWPESKTDLIILGTICRFFTLYYRYTCAVSTCCGTMSIPMVSVIFGALYRNYTMIHVYEILYTVDLAYMHCMYNAYMYVQCRPVHCTCNILRAPLPLGCSPQWQQRITRNTNFNNRYKQLSMKVYS